ncbi:hypothetical protein, partial [Brucella melitensis]|uniref:hypothetical protein n=1 Tax=Brucella melitensis TaxID=29459 RepID=UPI002264AE65
ASISTHFFTTSAGFGEKVAIEVFLDVIPGLAIGALFVACVGFDQPERAGESYLSLASGGSIHNVQVIVKPSMRN